MYDASIPVADRLEIQELYARYCQFADKCDGENWSRCFVKDGYFQPSLGPGSGQPYQGRTELAAFISAPHRTPDTYRHWNTALTLRSDGDEIDAVCYAFLLKVADVDAPAIAGSVVYFDRLAREDGRWLFKSREPIKDGTPE